MNATFTIALALPGGLWHGPTMPDPAADRSPPPRPASTGSGCFLLLAILAGIAVGIATGRPAVWGLAGVAVGSAVALWRWRRERVSRPADPPR